MIDFFKGQLDYTFFFYGVVFIVLFASAIVFFARLYFKREAKARIAASRKALQEANTELEVRVNERTVKLAAANEKLMREVNERRLSESALRISEEKYKNLVELTPDVIYLLDIDGAQIFVNDACLKLLEAPSEEVIGHPWLKWIYPEDRVITGKIFERIIKEGVDIYDFENRYVSKNGKVFNVQHNIRVIKNEQKKIIGTQGVARDITARKKAEKLIIRLNRQNELILKSAGEGIYGLDLNGDTTFANPAAARMIGWEIQEIIGKSQHAILHHSRPDGTPYPKEECHIYAAFRDGLVHHVTDEVFWKKDGSSFPVEYISTPVIEDGSIVGAVVVFRDITEQKKTEQELKEHRERLVEMVEERTFELRTAVQLLNQEIDFRKSTEGTLKESEAKYRALYQEFDTLLDAIPDTLLLLSPDLEVKWANKGAASEFKKEVSGIEGQYCYDLWNHRTDPCEDCHVVRSFRSGQPEISRRSAEGRVLESKVFPIKDEDERVINVILIVSDITEKTNLEAEAMRASHLASLGELAAGVAHEINNPINGIINYAQLLINRSAGSGKERDVAGRIIKEGDRIAVIVRGLLSFARERREEKLPIDIRRVIFDSITLTEAQIKKEGIDIKINIPPDLPEIVVNPQQMQQVFLNIISNARYALNQKYPGMNGDKKLEISGENMQFEDCPSLRIVFCDNGTGMPASIIGKIMNPFFSTKPSGQGTGLGLSISHGIIKDHGGRLTVESEEGIFTRVIIDLPLAGSKVKYAK